ncbi:MAG: hypothetical protein AAGA17_04675 [Actinomycetota bacterium]
MRVRWAIVVAGALALAACGSDGEGVVAADEAPVGEDEWRELPLTQAMGWAERGPDSEEEFAEQEREIQELTAECMTALGFEYQPVEQPGGSFYDPTADLDVEWGSREFAEQYGLGMSTFFEREQEAFAVDDEEFVDPNQDYVESLSDGEREAFYEALHGESPEIDESWTEEEIQEAFESFVPTGCDSEARAEVYGPGYFGGLGSEAMQEFNDLQQDLYQRIEADPRVVEMQAAWQACMTEAGHDFADEQDMYETLSDRMNELYESQSFPGDDLTEEEFEALTSEQRDELFSQPPDYDRELLAEIQAAEIDVAVDHHDCSVGSARLRFEVQRELEAEFVEQHADLIDEVRGESS